MSTAFLLRLLDIHPHLNKEIPPCLSLFGGRELICICLMVGFGAPAARLFHCLFLTTRDVRSYITRRYPIAPSRPFGSIIRPGRAILFPARVLYYAGYFISRKIKPCRIWKRRVNSKRLFLAKVTSNRRLLPIFCFHSFCTELGRLVAAATPLGRTWSVVKLHEWIATVPPVNSFIL